MNVDVPFNYKQVLLFQIHTTPMRANNHSQTALHRYYFQNSMDELNLRTKKFWNRTWRCYEHGRQLANRNKIVKVSA